MKKDPKNQIANAIQKMKDGRDHIALAGDRIFNGLQLPGVFHNPELTQLVDALVKEKACLHRVDGYLTQLIKKLESGGL
jgi:hypothetical protein